MKRQVWMGTQKPADRSLLSSRQGGNILKVDSQGGAHVCNNHGEKPTWTLCHCNTERGMVQLMLQGDQPKSRSIMVYTMSASPQLIKAFRNT